MGVGSNENNPKGNEVVRKTTFIHFLGKSLATYNFIGYV